MGVAKVIRHFPFLSCAAVWRIEAAADSGRSPNRVAAPNVRSVAWWNGNDRAAGRVRPDVIGVRARIIAQLHIRAEIGLDGGRLPGVPVVGHADDSAAAPFDDEQVRLELLEQANRTPGVSLDADKISKRPRILLSLLAAEPPALAQLKRLLEWVEQRAQAVV